MSDQRLIFSVSQLNAEIGRLLQDGFPPLWIEGEISNLSRPGSGHLYFTLKDEQAQLRCAMFKSKALNNRLNLDNGMKVLARGQVGLYEPRGDYQFIVSILEDAGLGQLQREFEALKQKLQAAGMFSETAKQRLPPYPRHIGIITSPSGAAIRDILNVLQRRCPHIPVTIYPVSVQGSKAGAEIVSALQQANQDQRELPCDVLILARGGGSLEDLWPFNEEQVATAIFNSRLPVITGIGHEIDFTIADFVADQRAPTPSAAAELISADSRQLSQHATQLYQRLLKQQNRQLEQQQQALSALQQRLQLQQPGYQLQQKAQRLDEIELRLSRALQQTLDLRQQRLKQLELRLDKHSPAQHIRLQQQQLHHYQQQLYSHIRQEFVKHEDRLQLVAAQLHAYSPLATLQRGYSLTSDPHKKLISSVRQLRPGQTLTTRLADGEVDSIVMRVQTGTLFPA